MPLLIEHIDAIARQKQRDVLFLEFADPQSQSQGTGEPSSSWSWKSSPDRQSIIDWLKCNQIAWQRCGDLMDETTMSSYAGQIYLDVPFNDTDPVYQKIIRYLENPDGSSRVAGVKVFVLRLAVAMTNVHHDEPGFWDLWVEDSCGVGQLPTAHIPS